MHHTNAKILIRGKTMQGGQMWNIGTLYFLLCFSAQLKLLFKMPIFFLMKFLFYFIFKLYNIVLVLPNIEMNLPQVYTCSPSRTLLPLPSSYHPSGSSQCTSPKHPVLCIEPGLATRFIYDIIHVSMPFSQIIHPLPLPQSPKDCSIHLCLFCCLTYKGFSDQISH